MSLLAYSPLGGGVLTGKYLAGLPPPGSRFARFKDLGLRFRKPIVHEAVGAYAALARQAGLSLVELALGYVKSRWHLGASIIGATSQAQLEQNIAAGEVELDAATLAAGIRSATAIRFAKMSCAVCCKGEQ